MAKTSKIESTNADIKGYLERACNIESDIDTLKEDKKALKAEMDANGINCKAFAIALKEKRKPIDPELKAKANFYLEASGQFLLFA